MAKSDSVRCPLCEGSELERFRNRKTPADFGIGDAEAYRLFRCLPCRSEFAHPRRAMVYDGVSSEYAVYSRFVDAAEFEGQIHHTLRATAHWKDSPTVYRLLSRLETRGLFLDFAAGSGYMAELARRLGFAPAAIEASPQFRDFLRNHVEGVRVFDTIDAFAADGSRADAILAAHAIEHLEDPVGTLAEFRSVLSPQGLLIVVVPNLERAYYRFEERGLELEDQIEAEGVAIDFPPHHLTRFSALGLERALARAGFAHVAIGYAQLNVWDLFHHGLGDARFRFQSYAEDPLRMKLFSEVEEALDRVARRLGLESLGNSLIALGSNATDRGRLAGMLAEAKRATMKEYRASVDAAYAEHLHRLDEIGASSPEAERYVASLKEALDRKNEYIHGLKSFLAERERQLEDLQASVDERQRRVVAMEETLWGITTEKPPLERRDPPAAPPQSAASVDSAAPAGGEPGPRRAARRGTLSPAPEVALEPSEIKSRIAQHKRWYHRIELAPGIVTPGTNESRRNLELLDALGLPRALAGKRVLDIGCRDGFFCFEMERRGAEVVGIDTAEVEDTGFPIAAEVLGSRAEFHTDDVYNLSPERYGVFDLVLFLGVIYHLRHPMMALERIRNVLKPGGSMVLESQTATDERIRRLDGPAWQYFPANQLHGDSSNKWVPNLAGLCGAVEDCGFLIDQKSEHGERVFVRAHREPEADFRLAEYFDRQFEVITGEQVYDREIPWDPVTYATSLRDILAARDREIESIYAVLKKANESVEPLEKLVAARDAQIENQRRELEAAAEIIEARTEEVESIRAVLEKRDEQLESIHEVLTARDEELQSIKPVLAARDEELESVKPVLAARDEELEALRPLLATRDEELRTARAAAAACEHELAGLKATFLGKTQMRLRALRRRLSGRREEVR